MASLPPILDTTIIEKAVENQLVSQVAAIRQAAVQKGSGFLFNNPAIAVSIFETGKWVKEGKYSYLVPCTLHVLLTFMHPQDEELRRKGINPLVFLIILALVQQKLGLNLKDPGIEPTQFRDVSSAEDFDNKKCVYLIEFSCGFYFDVPSSEDAAADLIGIAIDYLLEPGDDIADAQDETTL